MWWYIAVLVASFAMSMATVYTGHSGLPWYILLALCYYYCLNKVYRWGLIVALIVSTVFLPFVVTVYAITGENKHKETRFAAMLNIFFSFLFFSFFFHPSGFVPNIQNVVQVSNGYL